MMVQEIIDQFDEQGNYVGTINKKIAHQKGLWHKAVHVWIVNDNDEIMLQYRCSKKDFFPDIWDVSFAGHVDSGETSIDAAIREGKEELGLDIKRNELKFLFTIKEKLTYKGINSNEFVDVFLLRKNIKLDELTLQETEVGNVKYMKIDKFLKDKNNSKENIMYHEYVYNDLKRVLENR